MKGKDVLFMSTTDEWETPLDIYQDLDREFHFTLDPCCTKENQKCNYGFGCGGTHGEFIHLPRDGLMESWGMENCFVNPPHSTLDKWVKKSYEESRKKGTTVVMLIPARSDRVCWHEYVMRAEEIWFVDKRISFIGWIKKPGQKDVPDEDAEYVFGSAPSTFPSAIVVFDPTRQRARHRDKLLNKEYCPFVRSYIQPKNRGKIHAV